MRRKNNGVNSADSKYEMNSQRSKKEGPFRGWRINATAHYAIQKTVWICVMLNDKGELGNTVRKNEQTLSEKRVVLDCWKKTLLRIERTVYKRTILNTISVLK